MKKLFIPIVVFTFSLISSCKEEIIDGSSFILTTEPITNANGIVELPIGVKPSINLEITALAGINRITLSGDHSYEDIPDESYFPVTNTGLKTSYNQLPITGVIGELKKIVVTVYDDDGNSTSQEVLMEIVD